MNSKTVLVIEDDPGDRLLIQEAFAEVAPQITLEIASDSRDALPRIEASGIALVVLDLNLAGVSGLDLLAARAERAPLRRVPVIVFTTSSSPADVQRAYELGANAVVTKPADLDRYFAAVRSIVDFWFSTVTRPEA